MRTPELMENKEANNSEEDIAPAEDNQTLLERINATYDDAAYAEDQVIMWASRRAFRSIIEWERLLEEEYEREQPGNTDASRKG